MSAYVHVCGRCCELIDVTDTRDVVSECHRKYCWLCGFSSDSGLSSHTETHVRRKCAKSGIELRD